jgi:Fe2+ or Zn2+ uptake regulation protein
MTDYPSPHQQQVLDGLKGLDHHPTVRSLADHLESRFHRSERWSDSEVRGVLERLVDDGYVARYEGSKGEVRYQLTIKATEGDSAP